MRLGSSDDFWVAVNDGLEEGETIVMDTRSSEDIIGILNTLNREQGLTVVIITHEPDIAAATRRVISLRDGMVIDDRPEPGGGFAPPAVPVGRFGP